jgi:hypothetical protein
MTDRKDVVVDDWSSMAEEFFAQHAHISTWCVVEGRDGGCGIAFGEDDEPSIHCDSMDTAAVILGALLVASDALECHNVSAADAEPGPYGGN